MDVAWYGLEAEDVFRQLSTGEKGLDEDEAKRRLRAEGANRIALQKRRSAWAVFFSQFSSFIVILLLIAGSVSLLLGLDPSVGKLEYQLDAYVIFFIIIINAVMGFFQETKAENAAAALESFLTTTALVVREGKEREIDAQDLVPGDVIILQEGMKVPADARLFETNRLQVDESVFTGESVPAEKHAHAIEGRIPIADQRCMAFMNTFVTRGEGRAIVVATAMKTEIGAIADQIGAKQSLKSTFDEEVDEASKRIAIAVSILIIFMAVFLVFIHKIGWVDVFLLSISLAVGAIPEGLPAVVTFALSMGSLRMSQKKCLVRKLSLIESLGSVDTICTDKTGTLTKNQMTVEAVYVYGQELDLVGLEAHGGDPLVRELLACATLCNEAIGKAIGKGRKERADANGGGAKDNGKDGDENSGENDGDAAQTDANGDRSYLGDPTETALLVAADRTGFDWQRLRAETKMLATRPFDSDTKEMSVLAALPDKRKVIYVKGAPEQVIASCTRTRTPGGERGLDDGERKALADRAEKLSAKGYRVLGFASAAPSGDALPEKGEGRTFLGFLAMEDPPREGVKEAIAACKQAGIAVKMITGDHKVTAQAIAARIGMGTNAVDWNDIKDMKGEEFDKVVRTANIFARMDPSMKLRIVQSLQRQGHRVAITGDGVNDAPALKKADVGVAMGLRGTDVAKDASSLILLDDNFATIVNGIEEGRTIFNNVRKVINYLLTANIAEVFGVFIASLLGFLPFTAIQILWVNFITDVFPALGLAVDPPPKTVMEQPPSGKHERLLNKRLDWLVVGIGLKNAVIFILVYLFIAHYRGQAFAQGAVFSWLVLSHFVRIYVIRQEEGIPFFTNKWVNWALAVPIALQLLIIYTPLRTLFGIPQMDLFSWATILLSTAFVVFLARIVTAFIVKHTPEQNAAWN